MSFYPSTTTTYHVGMDRNGNSIVTVKVEGHRAFSIQSNGNLPRTHQLGMATDITRKEVAAYIQAHGTKRQKQILGL
jgi:hypothetical protein